MVDGERVRVAARSGRRSAGLMVDESAPDVSAADEAPRACPRRRAPRRPRETTLRRHGDPRRALQEEFGYALVDAAPAAREDHPEHGRGRGQARTPRPSTRPSSSSAIIAGQRPAHHPGPASRSPSSSCARAWPSAARSPCAATGCGSSSTGSPSVALPAHPRLPGHQPGQLRRPRQLQPRPARADHLPGDRLRPHRRGPRSQRDHHDHGGTDEEAPGAPAAPRACRSAPRATPPRSGPRAGGASMRKYGRGRGRR